MHPPYDGNVLMEKSFPIVCDCLYQYLHHLICFNIFWFLVNNSKTNLKFDKSFVELVETNPLMYNIKDLG